MNMNQIGNNTYKQKIEQFQTMEEIKQIGLNIWGLRGGHKSFCHSDNLDINVSEILRTWLDIRDILYVSDLTVRFYALEFTPKYKVYTLYRPENDTGGRSGAYVATTLYVPHGLKINHTLELLRQISDAYHNDHYDAFGNPNTNPDYVQNYLDLIMNFSGNMLKEHDLRSWEGSAQNGIPKILPFTRLSVVEEFFDRPYRKEFLISQEVMFWDVDCLQNQQSHGVTFLKKEIISSGALFETDGKNIAPQFEGGVIKNTPMGYAIKRFVREGVDITSNWQSCFFFDKTIIDIELSKPYHHPLTYKGSMYGIDSPFVKHGRDDYDFSPRISFQPRRYEVPVSVANVGNTAFALYFDNQRVDINGGRGIFAFDGSLASKTCKVSIKPDGVTDFKVTDLMMSKFFVVGSDEPDRSQPFIIENLKVFRFKFNIDCSGLLKMRWTSSAINFSTTNKMFDIVLTAEKNASDFVFEIDGYISEIKTTDNTTFDVTLTKQNYIVEIDVPETIRAYLRSDDIRLKAAGKTYKGYKASVPIATKSTDLYLEIDVDGKGHALKCDYDISRNGDDVTLHPKLALLHNSHDKPLSFSPKGITFELPAKSTVPVPDYFVANLENHNDKFKIETEIANNGIRRIVISLKAAPMNETTNSGSENNTSGGGHSDSGTGYQVGYQGGGNYGRSTRKTNEVIVGSYWYRGEEVKLFAGETNYTKISEGIYTVNIVGRECLLCFEKSKAVPDKQKKLDKDNKRNGFKIEVKGGKYYVEAIERGNGNKGMPHWLLWSGIGLGALLIIGGILWMILGRSQEKKPVYVICIEMTHDTKLNNATVNLINSGKPDGTFEKVANNIVNLYEDWKGVDIVLETEGEGKCEKISVSKDKSVTPRSSDFFSVDKNNPDTIRITVTSPAWMEIEKLDSEISKTKTSDSTAIAKYAAIAKNREYNGTNIKNICEGNAFNRVVQNQGDKVIIELFMKEFPQSTNIDTCREWLESIQKEQDKAQMKKNKLEEFESLFKKVRSKECNQKTLNDFKNCFYFIRESVLDYEDNIKSIITKYTNNKLSINWINNCFIPYQEEFLKLFDGVPNYQSAKDIIVNRKDNLASQTASFCEDQINLMMEFVKKETIYNSIIADKANRTDGKYYLLIEEKTN